MTRLFKLGLLLVGGVFVLDQITKWWILTQVMDPPRVIYVTDFFNLVMVWNRGISFGMFASDNPMNVWILTGIALAISAALGVWLWRVETRRLAVALGLVIGGALGNAVDRVLYGAVADFVDLHVAGHHWPAFNVADAAISCGAALLILDALIPVKGSPKLPSDPEHRP